MTEELYAFDAEYRARAGVVCGVDDAPSAICSNSFFFFLPRI